jgi:hypothetical protein
MFNLTSCTDILLPASICNPSWIHNRLEHFDNAVNKMNPNYKNNVIWLMLEINKLTFPYDATLCMLESNDRWFLDKPPWKPKLCAFGPYTVEQMNSFSDNYRQKSRTSIKQLMCIEQLCIQSLILDIYKHISYWLKMQLPYWRINVRV